MRKKKEVKGVEGFKKELLELSAEELFKSGISNLAEALATAEKGLGAENIKLHALVANAYLTAALFKKIQY